MKATAEKTFAEFFAGIGLMRMGLERAGWNIAFANDIDEDKWQMYRDHFGDTGEFVVDDVHKIDPGTVPAVALATASFPPALADFILWSPEFNWRIRQMPRLPAAVFSLN